ncbi:MAG: GxxExxY protein [Spirosomataceae bacterium]
MTQLTQRYLDELSYEIIGAAIEVHKELRAGLMEKVYEKYLIQELKLRNLSVQYQGSILINYKGITLDTELRYDLLVENQIVVELKAVEKMLPLFEAQLLSYMKLLGKAKGILINFNCNNIFKEGQKTFINEFYRNLPQH